MIKHTYDEEMGIYEKEETMKCEKCGVEYIDPGCIHQCKSKPNPSPREIFTHIRSECERKAFDEFMIEYRFHVWDSQFTDETLNLFKEKHPDWYSWLQSKGLVPKQKVKRQAWVNVMFDPMDKTGPFISSSGIFPSAETAKETSKCCRNYIKTILLHEWEEEV